ncbi:MAG TPA: hypothetical protein VF173_25490 [Thermoanaerobaculia bacterium]|nr:hypothetical protein [Thermoanaerobaculia bacterium]
MARIQDGDGRSFGWHRLAPAKAIQLREKLANFESMTWHEILTDAKKRNHAIPIEDLCKEAQDRLEEVGLGDLDELVSLRLSGTERVWGMRDANVLVLVWWDPDHAVCPSLKKHT